MPFGAAEQDVLAFFAKHEVVEGIAETRNAVKMLTKPNGKPLGQAVVQMRSCADADIALQVLNGQYMGARYIEVFRHAEDEPARSSSGDKVDNKAPAPLSAQNAPRNEVLAGPYPGVGDTGGSGATDAADLAHVTATAAFPSWDRQWWQARQPGYGMPPCPMPSPQAIFDMLKNAESTTTSQQTALSGLGPGQPQQAPGRGSIRMDAM